MSSFKERVASLPHFFLKREGESRPKEFKVVTEGGETIYQWLGEIRNLTQPDNPFVQVSIPRGMRVLPLGGFRIKDKVMEGLMTMIRYSDRTEEYEFKNLFVFERKRPESSSLFPLDLASVNSHLQSELSSSGYQTKYLQEHQAIVIAPPEPPADQERKTHISFHFGEPDPEDSSPQVNYCLHLQSSINDSPDVFQRNYQDFAGLIEAVTRAIYRSKRSRPPRDTYRLSPVEEMVRAVFQARKSLEAIQNRVLNINGVLGNGLEGEIKTKMFLQEKPEVTFADVAGLEEVKEELVTVAEGLKNPEIFEKWGTSVARGILLHGKPGTGKTLLARALANRSEVPFYVVNYADVTHHLFGKQPRMINALFDEAAQNGPAIIFFDELDALAPHRDHSTEVTSQTVSVLLNRLDGLQNRRENLVVIGATNRLKAVDPALLRPGRFDLVLQTELPDNTIREEIFKIHIRLAEARAGKTLFEPLDFKRLVEATKGESGAVIDEVIRRALRKKAKQETKGETPGRVTTEELITHLKNYQSEERKEKPVGFRKS